MYNIILISHGGYAKEIVNTAKLIVGEQRNVESFGLLEGADLENFEEKIRKAIERGLEGNRKLLVLTDLMFGTPFNVAARFMDHYDFDHITGINLPMYLEVVTSQSHLDLDILLEDIVEKGKSTVIHVNAMLKEGG